MGLVQVVAETVAAKTAERSGVVPAAEEVRHEPGPDGAGHSADDAVLAEVAGDVFVLLSGGRVMLEVLARPEIAKAMTTFGRIDSDPYRRLASTVQAVFTLAFGNDDERHRLAMHLRRIHRPVRGQGWHASDPELMFHTLACLMNTGVDVFEDFVRPLTRDEREAFYEAALRRTAVLGTSDKAPPDWVTFTKWFDHQLKGARVTDEARSLRWQVLYPRRPGVLRSVTWLWRHLAVSGLPNSIREEYGIHLTLGEQHRLALIAQRSRRLHNRFPGFVWDIGRDTFAGVDVLYSPPSADRSPVSSWHLAGRAARSLGGRARDAMRDGGILTRRSG